MSPQAQSIRCRTLLLALVTTMLLTLAVSAQAQPADIHAPLARTATANARAQDLRHLRAGASPATTYSSAATTGALPGPPTWPAHPQPIKAVPAADDSSDVNWTTIGLGLAGSLLAVSGIFALTGRHRRLSATP
jgi:hypothetical protein